MTYTASDRAQAELQYMRENHLLSYPPPSNRSMIRDNPPNRASRQPGAHSITRVTRNNSNLPIVRATARR